MLMVANVLVLVCAVVIGARVTRLVTADRVFEPFRNWVFDTRGAESKLTYFVHCPWCVGMWVAVVFAALAWWTAPAEWPITAWWGVPGVVALMAWINGFTSLTVDGGDA